MRLAELQGVVQEHILAGGEPPTALLDAVRAPARERWRIYSDAYRIRLVEAIRKGSPALAARLGAETFGALILDFVNRHPSVHRSIRDYGAELADWLRCESLDAETPELGMLADLAAFEWALAAAFDAEDAPTVAHADLAALAPAEWAELRFAAAPCVRRILLGSNAVEVRGAVLAASERAGFPSDDGMPEPRAELSPTRTWLAWRAAFNARFRALDEHESEALDLCLAGMPFGELCERLEARCGDSAPLQAATWLKTWTADGLLVRRRD